MHGIEIIKIKNKISIYPIKRKSLDIDMPSLYDDPHTMFSVMMFQIGTYDKQLWERSVEQKVIQVRQPTAEQCNNNTTTI